MTKKHTGRVLTTIGFILLLLPGGCDMFSVSSGLWNNFPRVTHEHLLVAFGDILSMIVEFSFLSWPVLGLGLTLLLIGQRRRKAIRDFASAIVEGPIPPPPIGFGRLLNAMVWLFTAGTVGMGCWIIYILIILGTFPSVYTPAALGWAIPERPNESPDDGRLALDQTIKRCVFKFAPQDAQGPGNAVTFRFSGWFIDTSKADRIEYCISTSGYTSISPAGP